MSDRTDELIAAHRKDVHAPPPHLVQQWHDAVDRAASQEQAKTQTSRRGVHPTSFFMGMAIAATLALGIAIGVFMSDDAPVEYIPVAVVSEPAHGTPVSLSRGLQVHFRESREQLMNVSDTRDQTSLVLQIIDQNRLFEAAAENGSAPKLARVLRAFEPILLRLAAGDLAPADEAELRAQLAFEMNVMLTKLASESSDDSHTT